MTECMYKCEWCGKEYKRVRATSLYCGDKCRLAFHRDMKRNAKMPTDETVNVSVPVEQQTTPEGSVDAAKLPENYGQPDCKCTHCRQDKGRHIINHGEYKDQTQLGHNELNRVSLPSDTDYDGVCNDPKYDDRRIAQAAPVIERPILKPFGSPLSGSVRLPQSSQDSRTAKAGN